MKVDNQLAKEINKAFNNDVDVTGYFWALNKDTLFHSYKGHHIAKANNLDMSIKQLADGLENINKGVIFKEKWDKEKNTRKIALLIASGEDFIFIADIYGGKKVS